jgi:hypothetical protein
MAGRPYDRYPLHGAVPKDYVHPPFIRSQVDYSGPSEADPGISDQRFPKRAHSMQDVHVECLNILDGNAVSHWMLSVGLLTYLGAYEASSARERALGASLSKRRWLNLSNGMPCSNDPSRARSCAFRGSFGGHKQPIQQAPTVEPLDRSKRNFPGGEPRIRSRAAIGRRGGRD